MIQKLKILLVKWIFFPNFTVEKESEKSHIFIKKRKKKLQLNPKWEAP